MADLTSKTALVTGGARRIGAVLVRALHAAGMNIALHYRSSATAARQLQDELNATRPESIILLQGDLLETPKLPRLVEQAANRWQRLDLLVNNASSFYPTPVATATEAQWDELLGSNLKAPFFLAQAAAPHLRTANGSIINLVDIYAQRPLGRHPIYCTAKAGLLMLTQALARELGPDVRVNGIAPGAILWPEENFNSSMQEKFLARTPLGRLGTPEQIAQTLLFLVRDADYITGQIIAVDGGRSIYA